MAGPLPGATAPFRWKSSFEGSGGLRQDAGDGPSQASRWAPLKLANPSLVPGLRANRARRRRGLSELSRRDVVLDGILVARGPRAGDLRQPSLGRFWQEEGG